MNLNSKIVLFVLLGSKSCSGLQLAYSADLFRAVLVDSWLITHFTASGGYRIKLQINYRSSVGQGSCVFVGGGGRVCVGCGAWRGVWCGLQLMAYTAYVRWKQFGSCLSICIAGSVSSGGPAGRPAAKAAASSDLK